MKNILNYIEQMKGMYEGPRITAQEPRNMDQAALVDELEPGALKDEMKGNFDPSQETHEEYLRRINLERPFNMAEGGQLVAPSVDGSRPGYQGPGKGSPGVPKHYKTEMSQLYTPEVRQKILETRKRKFQKTDPLGKRLQWIADNGKNYDSPLEMKKAYEKYFKHKIGTKADALFYTVEGGLGVTKKLGVDNAEVLIKRIYLDQIDNLINPSKQKRGVVSFTKRFSEDELFKASIIQNNPKVRNKFIDLFADINKNAGTYAAELGPEEMVLKLKSKGGYLLDGYEKGGFDFLFSYPRPGAPEQTIGGVHRGITRNTLINAGVPVEHIKSFQLVRKPLESIEEVLRKVSTNPNYAKKVWGVGSGTSQKIASQLNNFLEGQKEARKIVRDLDNMFIKGQMNKEGYTGTVDSYLKTDAGKKSSYNFTKVFGGVQFDHTLAKSIGRDYKYLPRNYLLKGQFTTGKFNRIKKDIFDLPLIEMLKKHEEGKISGTKIKEFIDDFNKKTGGYADFTFDEKLGKIVYPQEKKVIYDLSRYSNPEAVAKELERNIKMTMSDAFQKGYRGIISEEDLKGFRSKEAKQIGSSFQEIVTNSKRGGALLTHDILSKGKFKPKCKTKFSSGGGGFCGKAFAEAYPQEFLQEVMKDPQMAKYLKSKEALTAGRSILNSAAKFGRWGNPLTIVGGEAWYSTLAGINEFGKGKSLAESVNEGLWFIPGKHSRDLNMLLGPKTKGKAGRNLPVIPDEVRSQFDLLTQLGDLINQEGKLSGQLAMQQYETGRLEDLKARKLWEERFAPKKAFAPEKSAETIKLDYDKMQGDINWSKNIIPQIEKRLADVGVKGEDIVQKWQTADPTGKSYSALQDRIKSKIVDEFNIGKTWDQADPYSGPIWNWIKTREKIPFTNPELVAKQKRLDLLKEGPDQTITKENIPPELIENFLTKFPEYSYVFEGASGGRAGYMGGGITGIRKPHAIPPERGGLRSIMINVNDD